MVICLTYSLPNDRMRFRQDFNHRLERVAIILHVLTRHGWVRMDVVRKRRKRSLHLCLRAADFAAKRASLLLIPLPPRQQGVQTTLLEWR
ncbi:hypothetical protein COY28_07045 [Candidatus Woesearchaeota archaeon CG_4_10_14_0_2_um_filter_57_5]|nr:MAG: hypothetical protein AUJ68_02460 [Candidatus Woesearchaeota archaeon CG1_02_57_44]PIZ48689.1 MAG: hypothetical protein COY28_07045 [Candidatus Woesearchaeota archaeon CG_4_10_14_0_2_um_filter_57_5]